MAISLQCFIYFPSTPGITLLPECPRMLSLVVVGTSRRFVDATSETAPLAKPQLVASVTRHGYEYTEDDGRRLSSKTLSSRPTARSETRMGLLLPCMLWLSHALDCPHASYFSPYKSDLQAWEATILQIGRRGTCSGGRVRALGSRTFSSI